ncbi:MAG: helix-turn-helix domain-containing protein [gamma proteobacterium symbiont of Taylorina sp.]|nr:helix-turn-helix domain-containing protein [gamma proteobacterium symbiont of Taylorina sp.]
MSDEITTLTLIQASEFLQCNPETVRRLAKSNKIPASKIGRKWVFIKQDLAQFLRKQYSNPESVVQVVDKMGDESLCQYTNETLSGGLNSWHQMEKEYNALLGLETDNKPLNTKQS